MRIYTLLVAALLGILFALLGTAISLKRVTGRTGSEAAFQRLVRVHGNAAEHIPLVLILLFLLESAGGGKWLILGFGGAFLAARLMHAAGMLMKVRHPLHFAGATLTYLVETGLSVLLLYFYCH